MSSKFLPTVFLIGLLTWLLPGFVVVHSRLRGAPPLMLWAWERPEDLRGFTGSNRIGIAFLAATIRISQTAISVHHRAQPLLSASNHYLIPVVRIEADNKHPPSFSPEQINTVVTQILQAAAVSNAKGLQIDFDATRTQRSAYKVILSRLRKSLPPEMPLSITAIASWCAGDYWLADLPVDEVVPMYFDMGVKESMKGQYLQYIPDGATDIGKTNCKCHTALGLSTSEAVPLKVSQFRGKRIYFFSTHPWQMLSNQKRNEISKILKYTEAS
jgi:hypothetical protein